MAFNLTQSGQPANYNAAPETRVDGDPSAFEVDVDGNLKVNMVEGTLNAGDIEIGAVEIKDGTTDTRMVVNTVEADAVSNTKNSGQSSSRVSSFNGTTWDRIRSGLTGVQAAFTGFLNILGIGVYNSTPLTLADGEGAPTQMDANGNTKGTLATQIAGEDLSNDVLKVEQRFSYKYQAAAAANVVVKASAGYLKGIILGGLPIADAIIEVSDHASDGDGNVQIYAAGGDGTDALLELTLVDKHSGYIPVEATFATGITADVTNQTHVTFIYR